MKKISPEVTYQLNIDDTVVVKIEYETFYFIKKEIEIINIKFLNNGYSKIINIKSKKEKKGLF